jgi:hypothetical protein
VQQFAKEIIVRLAKAHVEFVVAGGISAVLQGDLIPVTINLDLCYRRTPANIARLVIALGPLQPKPRGFPADLPFTFDAPTLELGSNFTLEIDGENLDLLGEMAAIGRYEDVVGQAAELGVAGFKIKVLSLADLIATKQAVGRPKDLAAIPVLKATLDVQQKRGTSAHEPTVDA